MERRRLRKKRGGEEEASKKMRDRRIEGDGKEEHGNKNVSERKEGKEN